MNTNNLKMAMKILTLGVTVLNLWSVSITHDLIWALYAAGLFFFANYYIDKEY